MARRRRRRGRALALVMSAALVAAACSDPPTSGGDATRTGGDDDGAMPDCPLDALDDADGPVEVTLWYGGIGGPTKQTLEDLIAAFNAGQDRVVVTASDQGASFAEVNRKFESAAAAGADQLPDIVLLENTQLRALADSGLVLPAQACMEAAGYDLTQIEPAVRAAYTVDGLLYPGYMNVTSQVLYYNKAHWVRADLDPAAPPQTLDEIYDQAVALRDAGVSERPFSFKVSHAVFENWLSGEGIDVVDQGNGHDGPATEATFDVPEARDALELLQRMDDEGLINVFSNAEGSVDHFLALVTQESSMLIETSTASTTIAQAVSGVLTPAEAGVDFDASVIDRADLVPATAPFPGLSGPGQVHPGGGGFFIVGASAPAEQAGSWALLEFMLQPDNAKAWHLNGGYLPIVKSVQDEPDVQAFWQDDLAGVLLKPGVDQLSEAGPDRPGPLIGPYVDFTDSLEDALEASLFEGAEPSSSLAAAQDAVTESLRRYSQD
jgi:sn-glycerol 3-phosphate transport system substrate-binding protein